MGVPGTANGQEERETPVFLSLWPSKHAWNVFQRATSAQHTGAGLEAVAEGEK